jgi:hypothetical protein
LQQRRQRVQAFFQVGKLRPGCAVAALRRADADEMDVAELGGLPVGRGEGQPPGGQPAAQDGLQARLVYPWPAGAQRVDPARVGVDAQHPEAGLGHARRVDRAQVTGAEDGQPERGAHQAAGCKATWYEALHATAFMLPPCQPLPGL